MFTKPGMSPACIVHVGPPIIRLTEGSRGGGGGGREKGIALPAGAPLCFPRLSGRPRLTLNDNAKAKPAGGEDLRWQWGTMATATQHNTWRTGAEPHSDKGAGSRL